MLPKIILVCLIALALPFPATTLELEGDIFVPARSLVGTPYIYGSARPGGFDCSGFVTYLYKPFTPRLPRTSAAMSRFGEPVSQTALKPGDLVFFATLGPTVGVSHVAIYMGNDTIIHSVSNGPQSGVVINRLSARYWVKTYHSARRVLPISERTTSVASASDRADSGSKTVSNADSASSRTEGKTEQAQSPWDTYDGVVYGDFAEWQKAEKKRVRRVPQCGQKSD